MDLKNYFPENYEPTLSQSKALDKIQQAFKNTDTVIITAPTGTGKSFFASTLSNSSNDISENKYENIYNYTAFDVDHHGHYTTEAETEHHGGFVLTITKALQDQYVKLFGCSSLKGKNNYISTIDSTMDVEIESAVMPRKLLHTHRTAHNCNYYNDRRDLLISKFGVTNYKMFMNLPGHVKYRDYIICDEASELEDELVSQCSCTIEYERLKRANISINKLTSSEPLCVYAWLDDLVQTLQEQRLFLQRSLQKKSQWSPRSQTKYRFINQLLSHVTVCANNYYECEYVVEKDYNKVSLTPLYVDSLAKDILSFGKKRLLMSATIIDHKSFAKSLGIEDYEYIEVDSTFDSTRSPIYVSSKYPLSRKTMQNYLPKIVSSISQILQTHADEKGIIHTHTHEITQYIKDNNPSPDIDRLIFREPGVSNEDILNKHSDVSQATVLVSPSLTYGVDLKDDLARFQVIVKLPYLPLHDKRVKQLFDTDPEWYENKMLNSLVQACGRATRNKSDYSITYILDGMSTRIIPKCKHKLPKHFLQRFA